jgi:replicative DNA helicase
MGGFTKKGKEDMRKLKDVPMSEVAERAIVACCIWAPQVVPLVFEICSVSDFVDAFQKVFIKAVYDLWKSDVAIDLVTVEQKIRDSEKFSDEHIDVFKRVIDIDTMNVIPSHTNAEYYAKIVKEKRYERDLIRALDRLNQDVFDKTIDVKEKKELFDQAVLSLSVGEEHMEQDVAAIAKRIWESLRAENEGSEIFIPTGYERIDEQIGGFGSGELAIIAARPSNGKSTMLMEMAMSISTNVPVMMLSMEMNQESIVLRLLAQLTQLPIMKIKSGDLSAEQETSLSSAIRALENYHIFIDDSPMLSPASLSAKVMKAKAMHNVGCVMVDYIQLMRIPKWRSDNRVNEMTRISNELVATAKRARLPIIAASQMSRAIESRVDTEPRLSDLRETGALEQDADYVIFLYPYDDEVSQKGYEQFQPGINEPRQHCCKIAKCRQGPRDIKINLYWRPGLYTFKKEKKEHSDDIPF